MSALGHCGATRLYDTIHSRFYVPHLKTYCEEFKCADCQHMKLMGAGYSKLPPRHAQMMPWNEVAVDLIGPWKIDIQGQEVEFLALTCIDPVTNLVEIIRINNKTALHMAQQFENVWSSRYPRPNRCIHDNGGEFIGKAFQWKLQQHGTKDVPTTSWNPQANAVCERMHQTVANVLRTTLQLASPQNVEQATQLIENTLATTAYATRASARSPCKGFLFQPAPIH
jgi:transposase InsO family protein